MKKGLGEWVLFKVALPCFFMRIFSKIAASEAWM